MVAREFGGGCGHGRRVLDLKSGRLTWSLVRVWMISQDFPPVHGGVPTYAWELARRLVREHELTVVAPSRADAVALDRKAPFPVLRLPGPSDAIGVSSLLPLTTSPADVAFCTTWISAPSALAARRLGRVARVVVAAHGRELLLTPWPKGPQAGYDAVRRRVLQTADRCLPVSRYTADLLRQIGVASSKLTVVSNGTDPERFHPAEAAEGPPILLTVSRLVRRKGIDTVLAAWSEIAERCPDARYVIVGDGPDRGRLEDLARPHGDRVRFVGGVDEAELMRWYRDCTLFVMPARSEPPDVEGFGLVFLEAGACAKPVIGARAGGVVDAIDHEETGLLVPPDDPTAVARAVVRILNDRDLAGKLGRAGRVRAEASSWDAVAHRISLALQ